MFKSMRILGSLLLCTAMSAGADDKLYGPINVASTAVSGDQVRGPIKVQLVGVNVIQRNVQVGVNVTYPAGPDLTLPFIPPIPKSAPQSATPPTQGGAPSAAAADTISRAQSLRAIIPRNTLTQSSDVGLAFSALVTNLNDYEQTRYSLQGDIQNSIDRVNSATSQVTALVTSSDSALASDASGTALLRQIPLLLSGAVSGALSSTWPNSGVAALESNMSILKNSLATLPDNPGWLAWVATASNKTAYDAIVARVNDLTGLVAGLEGATNKSAGTMSDSQSKLQQWKSILGAVADAASSGKDPFSRTINVTCSFGFSNNKNSQIEMISTDRLAAAGTTASKQDIVTVICSSPFSISAGFGFSTVHEQQVSFIQSLNSSNQVVSVFGYKALSNPLPLLILNTRVHEWNDDWALHASTGAVVDIKTGAAGGTDVEYVAGLSVSYKRSFFITPGFHAGRAQNLAGGFTIGQTVPPGISAPPVESHWTPGFVLAFTYRLK
jgi:hypothetical protein